MASRTLQPEEKRAALRRLLAYPPITESQALSNFLEFVAEKAIDGDAQHLKEYVIATQVFKKPVGFDPRLDPIVRVHARRLRERMEEYYRGRGLKDPVRIVIPKGSYFPQFVSSRPGRRIWLRVWHWLPAALIVVVVVQAALLLWPRSAPSHARRMLSDSPLLAPFLASPHRTVITFSNDLFLKDNDGNMFRLKSDEKLDLLGRIQTNPRDLLLSPKVAASGRLYFDADYSGTGEAVCIFLLTRYFTERGKALEVRASSLFNPQELWESNVIFLGSPRENIILSKMVPSLDFRFVRRLNPAGRPFLAIENLRPRAGESALYEARLNPTTGNPQEVHAVISFWHGLAADSHSLVLAGESTAGTQAACEYLVGAQPRGGLPAGLRDSSRLPAAYQILLKTRIQDFAPTHTQYVTHHEQTTAQQMVR
ncbi:MAG: hypothetical protein AAB225_02915 [Acidobacteriota bacterium]